MASPSHSTTQGNSTAINRGLEGKEEVKTHRKNIFPVAGLEVGFQSAETLGESNQRGRIESKQVG